MPTKNLTIASIANMSVDKLEARMIEELTAVDHDLQGVDTQQLATHAKARAVLDLCMNANRDACVANKEAALIALWQKFGEGTSISAEDLLHSANLFAHQVHLNLIKNGWSYEDVMNRYACSAEVKYSIYTQCLPSAEPGWVLSYIVERTRGGQFLDTSTLVEASLACFGEMYAARHIQQKVEQPITKPSGAEH